MSHSIKTLYVIHHSHTDIGYTDLQERVIAIQVNYIKTVVGMMRKPEFSDFRWNCETLYCVEEYWRRASEEDRADFARFVKEGKIGISANYLNFNEIVDCDIYKDRLNRWENRLKTYGTDIHTAMTADINGVSMGYRDAMIDNGVKFLFMNVHCHHGMYPLYQNQHAFFWENAAGKRLLVWNGEHYNLGNVLGIQPNRQANFMMKDRLGDSDFTQEPAEQLWKNVDDYLTSCETQGYPYDFNITSVSGVFSDNAPPSEEILRTVRTYNERHGSEVEIKLVSLQELYAAIAPKLTDAPVYRGDFSDWWANGAGSTPYAVKHYKDADHRYRLAKRLDADADAHYPALAEAAQDNLMLYAEHTWGHSSTITNPYDTMVLNLDMRKNSYASKAHEAASLMLCSIAEQKGDLLRYYNLNGAVRAVGVSRCGKPQLVEFYIETMQLENAEIKDRSGKVYPCQISPHPRGRKISFIDTIPYGEEKEYTYRTLPKQSDAVNTRRCYVGAERVRDIVNDYDPITYRLPYEADTPFFHIAYRPGKGITSFVDKTTNTEMVGDEIPFFTPIYERTPLRPGIESASYEERRLLGRNIRGQHAELYVGELKEVVCLERGPVFTLLRLKYQLEGTVKADVILKMYESIPRIDFTLELGKTISEEIESVHLALNLRRPEGNQRWLRKGAEAFRPGIDQLPGSCMEFYISDDGVAEISPKGSVLIAARDVPLVYMGELRHHPITLCDGKPENNARPLYSWVMNNNWETNFKMDLSGFCQYDYTLWLDDAAEPEQAMNTLHENCFDPYVLMTE